MTATNNGVMNMDCQIRWLIRRDMDEVLAIEAGSFDDPWTEEEFSRALRQRNCIGCVAEHKQEVVGFMLYELHKDRLDIINFGVHPDCRRKYVGLQMVTRLIDKFSQQRRREIRLVVSERNLPAQQFFARMGFRAIQVIRGHWLSADGYEMVYKLPCAQNPGDRMASAR